MQALVIGADHRPTLQNVAFTRSAADCTVRVLRAGICGTDLQLLEGYAGFAGIPGHELVGLVDAVAREDDAHWIGRRVVAEINVGCGACEECRAGVKEHCRSRTVIGIRGRSGAFAEYVAVPAANLHAVPDGVSDETAVFVEPTAAACRVLEQVTLSERTSAAVLGDGRMGLIVAQVLRTVTPKVVVLGRHDSKLGLARTLGLDATRTEHVAPSSFDVVVDATGRADGLGIAIGLARPRGVVVMKSTVHGAAAFEAWPVVVHEVTLVGSRCGPFAPAMALLTSGAVRVEPLISAVFPLHDHVRAFHTARGALKVLFDLTRGS